MKIVVLDAQEGLNSNIINYIIQHTSHDVLGTISRVWGGTIPHLVPAMQAKNRFSYHWVEGGHFVSPPMRKIDFDARESLKIDGMKSLFAFEKVDLIIASNEHIFSQGVHQAAKYAQDHLTRLNSATGIPIVYLDSLKAGNSMLPGIRTLSIPNVFGPRMFEGALPRVTEAVLDSVELPATDPTESEWIYVKDVYFSLMDFIKDETIGNGAVSGYRSSLAELGHLMTGISKGTLTEAESSKHQIRLTHCRYALKDAIEHTIAWYASNPWIRLAP